MAWIKLVQILVTSLVSSNSSLYQLRQKESTFQDIFIACRIWCIVVHFEWESSVYHLMSPDGSWQHLLDKKVHLKLSNIGHYRIEIAIQSMVLPLVSKRTDDLLPIPGILWSFCTPSKSELAFYNYVIPQCFIRVCFLKIKCDTFYQFNIA